MRGRNGFSLIAGMRGNARRGTPFHLSGKRSASKLKKIADLIKANTFRTLFSHVNIK